MYKLGRREFLQLVGSVGFISLFSLTGCNNETTEEEKKKMLSYIAMQKYEFLTCENDVMIVKYEPVEDNIFRVTKLDVTYEELNEKAIYDCDFTESNENKQQFYDEFNVLEAENACSVFEGYYGRQDYYTSESIDYVLRNKKMQNKTKKLVK